MLFRSDQTKVSPSGRWRLKPSKGLFKLIGETIEENQNEYLSQKDAEIKLATKQDIELVQQDIEFVKQDIELVKQDIELVKQDIELVKQNIHKLELKVEQTKSSIIMWVASMMIAQTGILFTLIKVFA